MQYTISNTWKWIWTAKMRTKLSETFLMAKSSRFNLLSDKHTLGHKGYFFTFYNIPYL